MAFLDGIGLGHLIEKLKAAFVLQSDTQTVSTIDIDSTPTANSNNLVTSGGVKSYVDAATPESLFVIPVDMQTSTVDSSITYQDIVDAYDTKKVFAISLGSVFGIVPATRVAVLNGEYGIIATLVDSTSGVDILDVVIDATSSSITVTVETNSINIPDISTDISADATSDTKTASPKAVKTYADTKYTKPSGGIPESDLASAVTTKLNATEIFWATWDSTTYNEVKTALGNGKLVFAKRTLFNDYWLCVGIDDSEGEIYFSKFGQWSGGYAILYNVSISDGAWQFVNSNIEVTTNKISTLTGNESNTTKYPNCKAVYDALPVLNPTVPSGTTPTAMTGLKIGNSYYSVAAAMSPMTNNEIDTAVNTA